MGEKGKMAKGPDNLTLKVGDSLKISFEFIYFLNSPSHLPMNMEYT